MRRLFLVLLCGIPLMGIQAASSTTITLNGTLINAGEVYVQPFCVDEDLTFEASRAGGCIDRIEWNFGDGTTATSTAATGWAVTHSYTVTNWYPLEARIYCNTDENSEEIYSFTFRVIRPDTVVAEAQKECFTIDYYAAHKAECDELIANGKTWSEQEYCWDTVYTYHTFYGVETAEQMGSFAGVDSVTVFGKTYYTDADVEDTLVNEQGCNHYRRYHVTVTSCLDMSLSYPYEAEPYFACLGEDMEVNYSKTRGTIQGARFQVPGLLNVPITISNENVSMGSISLPTGNIKSPGKYHGFVAVADEYCDSLFLPLDFDIYYPENIFELKFNDVLAVYQKGHGGNTGYDFTAYQWYVNGSAVEGATKSVYYHGKSFSVGDEVWIVLTTPDGMTLRSCPKTIKEGDLRDYTAKPTQATARKMILNDRIVIQKGERTFDIYRQRVR